MSWSALPKHSTREHLKQIFKYMFHGTLMAVCITVMFVLKSSIWFLSWFSPRHTHQTWEQTSKAVAKHWAMLVENRSPTRRRQTNAKLPNDCAAASFLHLKASVKHQNQYCTCQFTLNTARCNHCVLTSRSFTRQNWNKLHPNTTTQSHKAVTTHK